jgi:prephenate dehydrogenase
VIRAIIVIGTGLIGTSVALAARRAGVTVFLSDRDPAAAGVAEALGAGVAQRPRQPVDLAVLAVPPRAVGPVLCAAQADGLASSYTDVCSVKGEPERIALRLAPDPAAYVGGHPMAGRERSGPLAATADLFAGRAWVLTPSARTDQATTERAKSLAVLCGGVPVLLSSRLHDDVVALTSHVPHLVASLMAARLCDGPDEAARLAGQGLRDVTRIAAGDPALWADIVRANAAGVAGVLRGLHADLSRLVEAVEALTRPDPADRAYGERVVVDLLERGTAGVARTWQAAATDSDGSGPAGRPDS